MEICYVNAANKHMSPWQYTLDICPRACKSKHRPHEATRTHTTASAHWQALFNGESESDRLNGELAVWIG